MTFEDAYLIVGLVLIAVGLGFAAAVIVAAAFDRTGQE